MSQNNSIYLLSILGTLAPKTIEAARLAHNQTAGLPDNIAAARALGDLSHMVYVPFGPASESGQFLILDQWNSLEGLNKFFADPHVQEGGGLIFSQRDPVVWAPAEGFSGYHCPAPFDRKDRIVAVVTGKVKSRPEAQAVHNAIVAQSMNAARMAGDMEHEAYFRLSPPGAPESLEFLARDVWYDPQGMARLYADPAFTSGLAQLFVAPPMSTVWIHPAGSWAEW